MPYKFALSNLLEFYPTLDKLKLAGQEGCVDSSVGAFPWPWSSSCWRPLDMISNPLTMNLTKSVVLGTECNN